MHSLEQEGAYPVHTDFESGEGRVVLRWHLKNRTASPVRTIQGIKKALRTCYLQRVRPA
nr:MAG TPA: hypothetical protein [Bacteriophage sp.]